MSHSLLLSALLTSYRKALDESELGNYLIENTPQETKIESIERSSRATINSSQTQNEHAIAIIGAGLAGLHAGYLLQKKNVPFYIFEADARIGGRINTRKDFSSGHTTDLGAEFIDTTHENLIDLARELNLELIDTQSEQLPRNLYFYQGKVYSENEVIQEYKKIMPQILRDQQSLDSDYSNQASIRLDHTPLSNYFESLGASQWFTAILNKAYTCEYGRETNDQSSLNFLNMMMQQMDKSFGMYGNSDELLKIKGGSGQLTDELEKRVKDQIYLTHKLIKITQNDKIYTLHFENGKTHQARQVLITIPYTVLRKVTLEVKNLSENKRRCVNELGYGTNVKLIQKFDRRIWRSYHHQGYLLSDIIQNGFDSSQLQNEAQAHGTYTFFFGGDQALELCHISMQEQLRDTYLHYFDAIFPGAGQAASPAEASQKSFEVVDWPNNPLYFGSYACFKPGQWTQIAPYINQPIDEIYFAGEHCSKDFQGFMNGAIQSSHQAIQDILQSRVQEIIKLTNRSVSTT